MKKVLAAFVAAAFSLSVAGTAMAAPAQVNQGHSPIIQIDKHNAEQGAKKKKKSAKKPAKKKQAAKKPAQKKAA